MIIQKKRSLQYRRLSQWRDFTSKESPLCSFWVYNLSRREPVSCGVYNHFKGKLCSFETQLARWAAVHHEWKGQRQIKQGLMHCPGTATFILLQHIWHISSFAGFLPKYRHRGLVKRKLMESEELMVVLHLRPLLGLELPFLSGAVTPNLTMLFCWDY